jgi:hypothetical protein
MFDTIEQKPDKKLLLAILALTLFGWIMCFYLFKLD